MKKENFIKKLEEQSGTVEGMIHDSGVHSDSALYGLLQSANLALKLAIQH